MSLTQKIFAIVVSLTFLIIVLDLARRRKLKVEYSILWIVTAIVMLGLVLWYDALILMTRLIGAVVPTTTLFIFGFLFLLFLNLHFSVKLSRVSEQLKNLAQEIAISRQDEQQKKSEIKR